MTPPQPALQVDLPFTCVTPTFLGGATPNDHAEIRPPSFLGAWREWFRLLTGPGTAGVEDRLFGAAGIGQGIFLLSLAAPVAPGTEPWSPPQGSQSNPIGRAYLGYTFNMKPNHRRCLPAGTRFTLRLFFKKGHTQQDRDRVLATVWCWAHLGGIGMRNRRGFGSVSIGQWPTQLKGWGGAPVPTPALGSPEFVQGFRPAETIQGYTQQLSKGFALAFQLLDCGQPAMPAPLQGDPPVVYTLDDAARRVWAGDRGEGWRTPEAALDAIGKAMQAFRADLKSKSPAVDGLGTRTIDLLLGGKTISRAPARVAFGLPWSIRDKRSGKTWEFRPMVNGKPVSRLPSPLLLHIARLKEGTHVVVLTRLGGALPGRDVAAAERGRVQGDAAAVPANRILDDFLRSLP